MTPTFYLTVAIVLIAVIMMMMYVIGNVKKRFWQGAILGAFAVMAAVIAHGYANLFLVAYLGVTLSDAGAALFVIGMLSFVGVIIYNLLSTGGGRLVR
ncbi:MAG: hypothetical protein FWD92_04030 [Methanomassiliicoccaceae archaeon]|nr:hypothetical protein [Methanomassiliicoccaceae archaeon]